MMKCVLLLMLMQAAWIIEAAEVILINKKLVKKKRGECVTFEGEHYNQTNGTFVWKKRETTTMVSGGRIRISGDRGNTVEIRQLEESDTAMYSAMIHTAGGLEITRHWLVVRGCDVNEKEIEFNGCEAACKAAVISINKKLVKKKRGECVTFEGEHYYQTNGTFVWKKRETTTMVSGGRIRISGDRGNTVEIRQLEESDTAMYSAMIHTAGGLEITRHWLVVRGCDVNEKEIEFNGCEAACKAMCLEGWHHFDDKCYRYFSQPRTWLSAYYYCQGQFGAKLATIDSSEENEFVGHLLMSGSGGWIGLNDRSKESRFLWNYNKFDQPAYFAWDKGDGKNPEPNNFNGQCNVENCVEMNSVNKKWNDVVCKAHRSYVCERAFVEDLPGWTCVDDNCYLYVREAVTWDWALKTCIEKNATLVTISSASKNNLVGNLIKTNIWIGLNDRVEAGIYVWNDIGQGQFDNKPSYLNWDREEPNDKHYDRFTPQRCDGEDCIQINIWKGVVTWFDLNCDIALPFICEKSRDPYLSFAAWIAISMGAGLILSVFGGRAYMEFKYRKGRKELKQMIVEATENDERKDL